MAPMVYGALAKAAVPALPHVKLAPAIDIVHKYRRFMQGAWQAV